MVEVILTSVVYNVFINMYGWVSCPKCTLCNGLWYEVHFRIYWLGGNNAWYSHFLWCINWFIWPIDWKPKILYFKFTMLSNFLTGFDNEFLINEPHYGSNVWIDYYYLVDFSYSYTLGFIPTYPKEHIWCIEKYYLIF